MRQPMGTGGGVSLPSAGRGLKAIVVVNVVAYVLFLVALRLDLDFVLHLRLVPQEVLTRGYIWQPVTSVLIHSPSDVGHLMMNMLFLWLMGGHVESWWGTKGFVRTYALSGLGGALLTVLAGVLVLPMGPSGPLHHLWTVPTLGASGAVLGVVTTYAAVQWNQTIHLFLIGPVKGKHIVAFFAFFQFLVALSFDGTSSTSHFGGMIVGYLIGRGYIRQDRLSLRRLKLWWTDRKVQARVREREKQKERFQVIEGGKDDGSDGGDGGMDDTAGPPIWGRRDDDDPVVH